MEKKTLLFMILALSLVLSGCGSAQTSAPTIETTPDSNALQVAVGNFDVKIQNFAFNPADINIEKGTTVVWSNEDSAAHIVVSDDQAKSNFLSPSLNTGDKYQFSFDTPGKYSYHCQIHPDMKGTITVK